LELIFCPFWLIPILNKLLGIPDNIWINDGVCCCIGVLFCGKVLLDVDIDTGWYVWNCCGLVSVVIY
jgi:hypothetical protein